MVRVIASEDEVGISIARMSVSEDWIIAIEINRVEVEAQLCDYEWLWAGNECCRLFFNACVE